MLKNAYLDAKIGVDTAENGPRKDRWAMYPSPEAPGHGEDGVHCGPAHRTIRRHY